MSGPAVGSVEWWQDLPPLLELTGVPVIFRPRATHNGAKLRQGIAVFEGCHDYALPLSTSRNFQDYPGELLLRPMDPRQSLLFGCATIATGDVMVNWRLVEAMLRPGCHE